MKREELVTNLKNSININIPIFLWRVASLEYDELPIIIIRDSDDKIEEVASGSIEHNLKIEIELLMSDNTLTSSKVRKTLNSILQEIKKSEDILGDYLYLDSVDLDLEQQERIVGRGMIELIIKYHTSKWEI